MNNLSKPSKNQPCKLPSPQRCSAFCVLFLVVYYLSILFWIAAEDAGRYMYPPDNLSLQHWAVENAFFVSFLQLRHNQNLTHPRPVTTSEDNNNNNNYKRNVHRSDYENSYFYHASSNYFAIPQVLIFTHKTNLLNPEKADPSAAQQYLPNIQRTIQMYLKSWSEEEEEGKAESSSSSSSTTTSPPRIWFLDNNECVDVLYQAEPRLVPFFKEETDGSFRGDVCRAAALYLSGGYYFDVDMKVVQPIRSGYNNRTRTAATTTKKDDTTYKHYSFSPETTFSSAITNDKQFFNSFIAVAPRHDILNQTLQTMLQYYILQDQLVSLYGQLVQQMEQLRLRRGKQQSNNTVDSHKIFFSQNRWLQHWSSKLRENGKSESFLLRLSPKLRGKATITRFMIKNGLWNCETELLSSSASASSSQQPSPTAAKTKATTAFHDSGAENDSDPIQNKSNYEKIMRIGLGPNDGPVLMTREKISRNDKSEEDPSSSSPFTISSQPTLCHMLNKDYHMGLIGCFSMKAAFDNYFYHRWHHLPQQQQAVAEPQTLNSVDPKIFNSRKNKNDSIDDMDVVLLYEDDFDISRTTKQRLQSQRHPLTKREQEEKEQDKGMIQRMTWYPELQFQDESPNGCCCNFLVHDRRQKQAYFFSRMIGAGPHCPSPNHSNNNINNKKKITRSIWEEESYILDDEGSRRQNNTNSTRDWKHRWNVEFFHLPKNHHGRGTKNI